MKDLSGAEEIIFMTQSNALTAVHTKLDGVILVKPLIHGDSRGWFYESYSKRKYEELGITADFVQDNRSYSSQKGIIRGLHCQLEPYAQAKLITCTKGAILDVAVDVREGSPTYMQWVSIELTDENKHQLFIPRGFLHGFVTLTDDVEVMYKTDNYYEPSADRSIRFDDAAFGVAWGIDTPQLSAKDSNAPLFAESDVKFTY